MAVRLHAIAALHMEATWMASGTLNTEVVGAAEFTAISGLLAACLLLAVFGGSAVAYAQHTAEWLARPDGYVQAVLGEARR